MNLAIRLFSSIIIFSCLISCTSIEEKHLEEVKTIIEPKHIDINSLKRVYVLTEEGCYKCNQSFAYYIQQNLDQENNSYCILNAKGFKIDISYFVNSERTVRLKKSDEKAFSLIQNSKILLMNQGRIDSTITIEPKSLGKTMQFLNSGS